MQRSPRGGGHATASAQTTAIACDPPAHPRPAGARLLLAIVLATAGSLALAGPAAAATLVVSPGALGGWSLVTNTVDARPYTAANLNPASTAVVRLVIGPPGGPAGAGALEMAVGAVPNSRASALAPALVGATLGSITRLSYSTYGTEGGPGDQPLPPNLKFSTATANFGFRTLVFEPARPTQTPRPVLDAWQTWDALAGLWWVNAVQPSTNPCGQANPCPLAQMASVVGPTSQIGEAYWEMGDSGTGFTGAIEFLDAVNINGTVYDFEHAAPGVADPVPPPTITEKSAVVTAGTTQTVVAQGFLPGEPVAGQLNSTTVDLGVQHADLNGVVRFTFTVPDSLPPGTHTFALRGTISGRTAAITFAVLPQLPVTSGVPGGAWSLGAALAFLVLGLSLLAATRARRLPRPAG